MIKKSVKMALTVSLVLFLISSASAAGDDMAKKLNDVLMKAAAEGHWQVGADDVDAWIKAKKTDFIVVDVRPNPPGQGGKQIPGAIYIPYNEILKPENLKKLPKDKKVVLVCVTGQTQNLPIVPLRALGYNAMTMRFGMAAWQKGYMGADLMKKAIDNAAAKNFPLEDVTAPAAPKKGGY